ncbi:hypothetical protein JNUCC83_11830 [Vagococcus sp. JNUCC 83]
MSSSKLPETGFVATSSIFLGIQKTIGLLLISFVIASLITAYIKRQND